MWSCAPRRCPAGAIVRQCLSGAVGDCRTDMPGLSIQLSDNRCRRRANARQYHGDRVWPLSFYSLGFAGQLNGLAPAREFVTSGIYRWYRDWCRSDCRKELESHWSDLNRRPLDYESRALPLSYSGGTSDALARIRTATPFGTTPSR